MKKIIFSTLMLLSSINLAPQQAHAGFVIGTAMGVSNLDIPVVIGIVAGAVVGGSIDASMTAAHGGNLVLGTFLGAAFGAVVGSVLDVDASLNTDGIAQALKTKYTFVNNAEAMTDLAAQIKSKFHTAAIANPTATSAMVRLTSAEVAQALSGTSITVEQFQQIASDLN